MRCVSLALVSALAMCVAGCSNSNSPSTTPTPTPTPTPAASPTFTATMLPANETPNPIVGPEAAASGTANIVFQTTTDAAGNVTSAIGTATVTMANFPSTTTITLAHIHTGAVGVGGPVLVPFLPPTTPVISATGGASFVQVSNISGADATAMMNNPAGYYFNVHTAANGGGVMRGQLVRTQ